MCLIIVWCDFIGFMIKIFDFKLFLNLKVYKVNESKTNGLSSWSIRVKRNIFLYYLHAILSPSLWQANCMALSTMAMVTLRPGWSSSSRQRAETDRKLDKHSLAVGTLALKCKDVSNGILRDFCSSVSNPKWPEDWPLDSCAL